MSDKTMYDVVDRLIEQESGATTQRTKLETAALSRPVSQANDLTISKYEKSAVKTEKKVKAKKMKRKHAKAIMKARKAAMKDTGVFHSSYYDL